MFNAERKSTCVYVDAAVWPYGRMVMCHMISENIESLHEMADKIGVDRRHFQQKRTPHYDICKAKRKMAVEFGAIALGRNAFVGLMRQIRRQNA